MSAAANNVIGITDSRAKLTMFTTVPESRHTKLDFELHLWQDDSRRHARS